MSQKTRTESVVNLTDGPVEDLPDFAFIGTDGKYYQIGKTPHAFVMQLKRDGIQASNITYETLDSWTWLHLRCVDGQHHIKPEDVEGLYFQCDIPHIIDCIFRRLVESKASTRDALKTMAQRLTQLLETPDDGEKENQGI